MKELIERVDEIENFFFWPTIVLWVLFRFPGGLVMLADTLILLYVIIKLISLFIRCLWKKIPKVEIKEIGPKGVTLSPSYAGMQYPVLILVLLGLCAWGILAAGASALVLLLFLLPALICLFWILRLGIHYRLRENGLLQCCLWLPLRRIPWEKVADAVYLRSWTDREMTRESSAKCRWVWKARKVEGRLIFVRLRSCPAFDPGSQPRRTFSLAHLWDSACIWVPEYLEKAILAYMEKHCPSFRKQTEE